MINKLYHVRNKGSLGCSLSQPWGGTVMITVLYYIHHVFMLNQVCLPQRVTWVCNYTACPTSTHSDITVILQKQKTKQKETLHVRNITCQKQTKTNDLK